LAELARAVKAWGPGEGYCETDSSDEEGEYMVTWSDGADGEATENVAMLGLYSGGNEVPSSGTWSMSLFKSIIGSAGETA
jgi:hypothetical protein